MAGCTADVFVEVFEEGQASLLAERVVVLVSGLAAGTTGRLL